LNQWKLNKKGRSASQVLQDDPTLTSVKTWGKSSCLKCRLRSACSCLDIANIFKNVGRSRKVSDWNKDQSVIGKLRPNYKWQPWKNFFIKIKLGDKDVMSKKEVRTNGF